MKVKQKRRKSYFHRNDDPSLAKIIFAICVVGAAVFGLLRFGEWLGSEDGVTAEVEASVDDRVTQAEKLLAAGDPEKAREVLAPVVAKAGSEGYSPKALILKARLDQQAGDNTAALANLRAAAEQFPNSPDQPMAQVALARLLERTGDTEEAMALFERIRATAPPPIRAAALSGLARAKEREGDQLEARELFKQAVADSEWGSEIWEEALTGMGEINVKLIFSSMPTPESKVHTVQKGESLTSIGIKFNTTQGLLMRANNITDPHSLRLNQQIKYTPKDFRIVIERSTCRLFLLDNEGIFKMYRVGLGKENRTVLGQYKIGNKEVDPTWFKPGSEPIPPGDPRNELGTRWMPLVPEAGNLPGDLGIHGTIAPETIGQYASMGCPRLLNDQVEELYDLVVRATPVTIVEEFSPVHLPGAVVQARN